MVDIDYEKLLTEYPFLTYLIYGGNEYIGVIQNVDDVLTTMYDYGALNNLEEKQHFIKFYSLYVNLYLLLFLEDFF